MKLVGHWLAIRSYKHDGSVNRIWDRCLILDNNEEYIVVASIRAKVTEGNGRCWFTKEPAITIFSKKEWWNAICMVKKEGICYYCNVASPCVVEGEYIKYVDYDLDVKKYPSGVIRVLDEREYKFNKKKYGYPDDLDVVLKWQTSKIVNAMNLNSFPFVDEKINRYYQQCLDFLSNYGKK